MLLLALLVACAHAPIDRGPPPLPDAPSPEAARSEAESETNAVRAADLAWILGNDRALARRKLDEGLAKKPGDPALLFRRARLADAELREDDARADLLAMIGAAPNAPETGLAIARLLDDPGDDPKALAEVATKTKDALLGAPSLSPSRAARLAILAARADTTPRAAIDAAISARGGILTLARALGPLAPRVAASLRIPTRAELEGIDAPGIPAHRGQTSSPRAAFRWRGDLLPVEGDLDGLHVLETYFLLDKPAEIALTVELRTAGRVRIDGALVLERRADGPIPQAVETVAVQLGAGWHRLAIAMLAGNTDSARISVLGIHGEPIMRASAATLGRPGAGACRSACDVVLAEKLETRPLRIDGDDAPPVDAKIEGDAFGRRVLWAELALSRAARDVEAARALIRPLTARAPKSAVAASLEARLGSLEGLPPSRVQAIWRRALEADPTHPGLLLVQAAALESETPEAAMALIDRARAAAPRAVEPELARFRHLRERGWNAEANASLAAVLERSKKPAILDEAARFHRTLVQLPEARKLEAELEAMLPNDHRAIAQALARGELDAAVTRLAASAGDRARPADVWRRIAEIEGGRGRQEAALIAAQRALSIEPHDQGSLKLALVAHRALGDATGARKMIEALRAMGASDLDLELYAADLDGRAPGTFPPGSWLDERLRIDPVALATRAPDPQWAGAARVRLLDRIVDQVRADGSSVSLHHQVVRLQTKEATDMSGEIRLPDGALPLALRTLKSDGRTVEVDRHAGKDDLSFSALAPGDSIEEQWIGVASPSSASGGYLRRFLFQTDLPAAEVELIVVVPKGQPVWWKSYHGAPEPEIHESPTETAYAFRARNLAGLPAEPNMAPVEEFLPFIVVSVGLDEAGALDANLALLGPIARPSREIAAVTASITAGATDPDMIIDRTARWVESHVREGHGEPTLALLTGQGTRTGLITALLRAAGLDTKLVLARTGRESKIEPPYPDPRRFDDVMIRVDLPGGAHRWIFASGPAISWGLAPPPYRGGSYVIADPAPPGAPKIALFAPEEIASWRVASKATLELDPAGNATGRMEIEFPGLIGASVRQGFRPLRKEDIARMLQGWLNGVLPGAELLDVDHSNLEPLPEPFRLGVTIRAQGLLADEGGTAVLRRFFEGPIGLKALGLRTAEGYLARNQRRMPMWVEPVAESLVVEVRVPAELGAPVDPPATFDKSHRWGRTAQRFSWDPGSRTARLTQDTELFASRVTPAEYPAFREVAQEVALRTRNRLLLRR